MAKKGRNSAVVTLIVILLAGLWELLGASQQSPTGEQPSASTDPQLEQAFRDRANDLQIAGEGTVVHMLPDDNKGSRHQRFLLELDSGLTLLVAHNIDLAPRIDALERGDRVSFYGEYEWNEKGGVIHWTHHDPRGKHIGGWLEHRGERYE